MRYPILLLFAMTIFFASCVEEDIISDSEMNLNRIDRIEVELFIDDATIRFTSDGESETRKGGELSTSNCWSLKMFHMSPIQTFQKDG